MVISGHFWIQTVTECRFEAMLRGSSVYYINYGEKIPVETFLFSSKKHDMCIMPACLMRDKKLALLLSQNIHLNEI
jgi:hypothetical protein